MSTVPFILFNDRDGWRVGGAQPDRVGVSGIIAPPDAAPEALAAALRSAGVTRRPVLLALPSAAFLCATVSMAGLPARQRGQAMLYRLEERLPVSAEDVVADFLVAGNGTRALGVCVQRRFLEPLLDVLRAAGVNVGAICPTAFLALQHCVTTKDWAGEAPAAGGTMIVWADAAEVELFVLDAEGTPRAWAVVPDDPDDVALQVGMLAQYRPGSVLACGVRAEVLERLGRTFGGTVVEAAAVPMRDAAALAARSVMAGKVAPWVDLAHAEAGATASARALAQARGPVAWVAACAAVLAVAVVVSLFTRAARYDRLAGAYETRQQEVFRKAFPEQPLPRDVRSRLASEEQRLQAAPAGFAGTAGDDTPSGTGKLVPSQGLLVLRDVIASLPSEVRFRIHELRLDSGRFTIQGEVRAHVDAEAIADALRNAGGGVGSGFEVDPPRVEFRAAGQDFGFTLTGATTPPPLAASSLSRDALDGGVE